MKHIEPEIIKVGAEVLINPANRVPADVWADFATMVLLEPEPALLREWISRAETKLQVTPAHREQVAAREERVIESSADKRRRLIEENMLATRLNRPMRDETLVQAIEAKQAKAAEFRSRAEALRAGHPKKNRMAAKGLEASARKLDDQILSLRAQEARQLNWGEAREAILRADQRGDMVHVKESVTAEFARDRFGARIIEDGLPALVYSTATRAKRLSGIDHASAAGYLGGWRQAERLHSIGVDYRDAYIVIEGEASGRGEGGSGFGPKAPQPRILELGQRLADMRRGLNIRQRDVLDLVCGKDLRLREATALLRLGDPRTTQNALVSGLRAAAQSLEDERSKRQTEDKAAA